MLLVHCIEEEAQQFPLSEQYEEADCLHILDECQASELNRARYIHDPFEKLCLLQSLSSHMHTHVLINTVSE
jgi:hypothetical protein